MARAGIASRRACEELIAAGRVTVNGTKATLGQRVTAADAVAVDGVAVRADDPFVYLALHKPVGVVTTAKDPQKRSTVVDLVPPVPRVFPIGRLDRDTAGLLLLTNDGEFALRMTHPRYGVTKTYMAEVQGPAGRRHAALLRRGVVLADGKAAASRVELKASSARRSLIELDVHEGRNRIVRRMLDEVGLPVVSLTRIAFGPIRLGRLRSGDHRTLTREEVVALMDAAGGAAAPGRTGSRPPST